jgi:hypothetical protein
LALQMSLGSAFTGLTGFGSPEREGAYTRASELCQEMEESRELFPVLWHLCQLNIQRGELRAVRELARQSLDLVERVQDVTLILAAHYNLGEICNWAGELTQAHVHLERAKTLYDPRQHASLAPIYGVDLSVTITAVAVWVDCLLGKPQQALKRAHAALERASALSHPFSRAFAPVNFQWTLFFLRAAREAEEVAYAAISVCTEQGFTDLLAWANCFLGWALIEQGGREVSTHRQYFRTHMDQDILGNIGCFTKRCFEAYCGHLGAHRLFRHVTQKNSNKYTVF